MAISKSCKEDSAMMERIAFLLRARRVHPRAASAAGLAKMISPSRVSTKMYSGRPSISALFRSALSCAAASACFLSVMSRRVTAIAFLSFQVMVLLRPSTCRPLPAGVTNVYSAGIASDPPRTVNRSLKTACAESWWTNSRILLPMQSSVDERPTSSQAALLA